MLEKCVIRIDVKANDLHDFSMLVVSYKRARKLKKFVKRKTEENEHLEYFNGHDVKIAYSQIKITINRDEEIIDAVRKIRNKFGEIQSHGFIYDVLCDESYFD